MRAVIFDRWTAIRLSLPGVELNVESYGWSAVGGPLEAELGAAGGGHDLAGLLSLVRCPVEIWDGQGRPVWWGFVSRVALDWGGIHLVSDIERVANRVAVAYTGLDGSSGLRGTTGWVEDAESIAELGRIEALVGLNDTTQAGAETERDRVLALRGRLAVESSEAELGSGGNTGGPDTAHPRCQISCRGWWDTLAWRYAAVPARLALGFETIGSLAQPVGTPAVRAVAQAFDTSGAAIHVQAVEVYVRRIGNPSDSLRVAIYSNPDDQTPTTLLASLTLPGSLVPAEYGWVRLELPESYALAAGSSYFLVVGRTAAADSLHYYEVLLDAAQGYGAGPLVRDTGSWEAFSADLPFRLFDNSLVETTQQIKSLLVNYGQFFRRVWIDDNSGVRTESFRDGDRRARYEVEQLLKAGGAGGRWLARVQVDRGVRVFRQPAADPAQMWGIDGAGSLVDAQGCPADPATCPVGMWVLPRGAVDAPSQQSVTSARAFFVERAAYDAQKAILRLSGREA